MDANRSSIPSFKQKSQENQAEKLRDYVARKIVGARLANRDEAAPRWVWELLQNARDTAVQWNRDIRICVLRTKQQMTFMHSGGPFEWDQLDALIHAGSSKSFDLESTDLGRFGTGFLVTHAISPVVEVSGRMVIEGHERCFRVKLDRNGTEARVKEKLEGCLDEVDQVISDQCADTQFVYENVDQVGFSVVSKGLKVLDDVAPYLFAFNDRLQEVRINDDGRCILWSRKESNASASEPNLLLLSRIEQPPSADVAEDSDLAPHDAVVECGESRTLPIDYKVHVGSLAHVGRAAAVIRQDKNPALVPVRSYLPCIYVYLPLLKSECARLPVQGERTSGGCVLTT